MQSEAKIGHNKSPFQITTEAVQVLSDDLKNWLDGEELTTKLQHDTLVERIGDMRKAKSACDAARKDDVVYWNDGKQEVQDRYNPFLKMAKLAIDTAQKVLEPYLLEQTNLKRETDKRLAEEASKAMAEAIIAMKASSGDLAAREEAEHRLEDAKELGKIASRIVKQNVAKGGQSRWDVEVDNLTEAARWAWKNHYDQFYDFLIAIALKDTRAGKHEIPGFTITERIVV